MTPYHEDPWLTMYVGDCPAVMAALEAESVQAVITSPPYFGLRDYGVAGQIGLESTPEAYIEALVDVFRAVRRVLRPDGTVWLNLGDSYFASGKGPTPPTGMHGSNGTPYPTAGVYRHPVLKPKDRMLIPARVAIALCDDGWWVRDEVIWAKPNPMPSSVGDRTTPAHEMVYLLSKRARYYYDADAIREPAVSTREELLRFEGRPDIGHPSGKPDRRRNGARVKVPGGWDVDPGAHNTVHRKGRTEATYRDKTAVDPNRRGLRQAPEPGEANAFHPLGRNKRSVWTIATQPYPDAHFATFPEALVEPMVLAGSPPGGLVLDPFGGSGTTAMVANRLGRRAVHIDLSAEYAAQAVKRIAASRASGDGPAIDMPVPFADDGLWGRG